MWWAAAAIALKVERISAVEAISNSRRRHGSICSTIPAAAPAPAAAVVVVLFLRLHAAMPVASCVCIQQIIVKAPR
jgi:hypothetical protein